MSPLINSYLPQCYKTTMLNKIISSDRDLMGVILFGTNKTDNALNVPHIAVLQNLQQPNADNIKQLETMLKCKFLCPFHYHHTGSSFAVTN